MSGQVRRRTFLGSGAAVAALPCTARAQQDGRVRTIGVLTGFVEADQDAQARIHTFRQGLADLGWVEGRSLRIRVRWAGPNGADHQRHARDLVALAPAAILTTGMPTTLAMR